MAAGLIGAEPVRLDHAQNPCFVGGLHILTVLIQDFPQQFHAVPSGIRQQGYFIPCRIEILQEGAGQNLASAAALALPARCASTFS